MVTKDSNRMMNFSLYNDGIKTCNRVIVLVWLVIDDNDDDDDHIGNDSFSSMYIYTLLLSWRPGYYYVEKSSRYTTYYYYHHHYYYYTMRWLWSLLCSFQLSISMEWRFTFSFNKTLKNRDLIIYVDWLIDWLKMMTMTMTMTTNEVIQTNLWFNTTTKLLNNQLLLSSSWWLWYGALTLIVTIFILNCRSVWVKQYGMTVHLFI
jgi:hypothetical protein